jgi:hypothetical protein
MPTGFTKCISDDVSFEKFVMGCARAFGALITMRDDPLDAEIPDEFQPTDYHTKQLSDLEAKLAVLRTMSIFDAEIEADKEYLNRCAQKEDGIRKDRELRGKYKAMLAKVDAWEPPTDEHTEIKKFMMEQIRESIEFDCSESYYLEKKIEKLSGEDWLANKIESTVNSIGYHKIEHQKEVDRCAVRSKWVRELRQSLATQ